MQPAHVIKEVTSRSPRQRGGKHERHILAFVREHLQRPQCFVRIAQRLDPIVVSVPPGKLRHDVIERVPIFIDG